MDCVAILLCSDAANLNFKNLNVSLLIGVWQVTEGGWIDGWLVFLRLLAVSISISLNIHTVNPEAARFHRPATVLRKSLGSIRSCQEVWSWRGDASFLGKRRKVTSSSWSSRVFPHHYNSRVREEASAAAAAASGAFPSSASRLPTHEWTERNAQSHARAGARTRPAWRVNSYFLSQMLL